MMPDRASISPILTIILILCTDVAENACPSLPDEHGSTCANNNTGEYCKIECYGKYFPKNRNRYSICKESGDWFPEPKCITPVCPETTIPNGNTCNAGVYRDQCAITCNHGYYWRGYSLVPIATCNDYNNWHYGYNNFCKSILEIVTTKISPNMTDNNSATFRLQVKLEDNSNILSVNIILRGARFKDDHQLATGLSNSTVLSYKIYNVLPSDVGTYTLVATGKTIDESKFSVEDNVTLQGYLCNEIKSVPNGYVFCKSDPTVRQTICTFECKPGYFLNGNETISCISGDGVTRWPQVPSCKVDKYGLMSPVDTIPTIILGLFTLFMLVLMLVLIRQYINVKYKGL